MAELRTRIGVLALQGSYREHMSMLQKVPGVDVIEVRTKEELQSVSGLIIPGGESTTMALVAERWGLIPELQSFAKAGKPVWGTCAGMIFLAERAEGGLRAARGRNCVVLRAAPASCTASCTQWQGRQRLLSHAARQHRRVSVFIQMGPGWLVVLVHHTPPGSRSTPCGRTADAPMRHAGLQAPRRAARPS
jgi:phosphoribosylformylglycinamidine (FGAM) synthase-like amidotransferase family enzyme